MDGKHVTFHGPLFDGRAGRAVDDFVREFAEGYGDKVADELQDRFQQVFRHPTGNYARRIRARRTGTGESEVNAGVVPYARWLEGTSIRNTRSRFKGYRSVRVVAGRMQRRAGPAANLEFRARYLRRMNGGI